METNCKDCKFYLPVDVFRGICKIEKTSIGPDDLSCAKFERLPKCKFCRMYIPEKEFLGSCLGKAVAYPDMNASKCAGFEWSQQN
jgi:4-hydroxyphenylacetate decarboxylase small subunit